MYCNVVRGRLSHGHSNVYRKYDEVWTCGFVVFEKRNRTVIQYNNDRNTSHIYKANIQVPLLMMSHQNSISMQKEHNLTCQINYLQ